MGMHDGSMHASGSHALGARLCCALDHAPCLGLQMLSACRRNPPSMRAVAIATALLALLSVSHAAKCPYMAGDSSALDALPSSHPRVARNLLQARDLQQAAAATLDYTAVRAAIRALLTNSQSFWPNDSDFGTYGGNPCSTSPVLDGEAFPHAQACTKHTYVVRNCSYCDIV